MLTDSVLKAYSPAQLFCVSRQFRVPGAMCNVQCNGLLGNAKQTVAKKNFKKE
jgi:hypothetical protein